MTETEPEIVATARRRQNRRLFWAFGFLALSGPLMALFILLIRWRGKGFSITDVHWAGWVVLGVVAVGPAASAGLMLWLRRRGVSWLQPMLVAGVDRERSRSILAAVREGRPVATQDQAIAVNLARRQVQQRWISYLLTCSLAFSFANSVLNHDFGLPQALIVIGAVGVASSLPFVFRDVRRARRWLQNHEHDADH